MVEWRKRAAATRAWTRGFVVRQWLPLCFIVATIIALTWPTPGKAVASVKVGDVHVVQTINIVLVFTISGLVLKTDDLKKAIKAPLGIIYGFVAILLITPCLGFALRELPLTPPEFAVGLTIFAAVPTTLGVGEALVRASKGNAALALLLLVGTNAVSAGTMPPWLKLLLANVEGLSVSVDALQLFVKLLCTVLAPACVGKAARELFPPVARFATRYKLQLGMFNTVQLALIIWQTLSGAQSVLVSQSFLNVFVAICCAIIMHLVYLALNTVATLYLVRLPLREAIAATIMSSQKSAPVAVTVISYLTPDVTEQGLLAVPCIVGQLAQIFIGAAFAPHLARLVTRRERLEVLAAVEVPDPEAEAAAAAEEGVGGSSSSSSSKSAGSSAKEGALSGAEVELTEGAAATVMAARADSGPLEAAVAGGGGSVDNSGDGGGKLPAAAAAAAAAADPLLLDRIQ